MICAVYSTDRIYYSALCPSYVLGIVNSYTFCVKETYFTACQLTHFVFVIFIL